MTQKFPSDLLLTASRIQHRVPRRTVSPHTAQAFPRPVTEPGPRSFQKTFAIRGCRRRACFSIERHSSTSHRKDGADAPSRGKPRLSFAFPPANDSSTSLAMKDPSDVGSLSGRVTFKPVSAPLQHGIRFFQHPKPAPPWAHLTARCPECFRSDTGFPRSAKRSTARVGAGYRPRSAQATRRHEGHRPPTPSAFWRQPINHFGWLDLTIFITDSRTFTLPAI